MTRLEEIRERMVLSDGLAWPLDAEGEPFPVVVRYADLMDLLAVAEAARSFARCYAPITDEDAQRIVGPCGACGGCQLAAALAPLTEEENRG